jgi:uncharacterized protein GlcG (DUF336 family)
MIVRATEERKNRIGRRCLRAATVVLALSSSWPLAFAQVSKSAYVLPLDLALDAAIEAVKTCSTKGYDVTATVVDIAGTPQVVLRGDHATIHTKDSAFRKAYTIVTMGSHLPSEGDEPISGFVGEVSAARGPVACVYAQCIRASGRSGDRSSRRDCGRSRCGGLSRRRQR